MSSRCVVLVGLPGSGKTSVGRALRDRHGWSWIDLDEEVEKVAGRSITELIRVEGEQQFRDLESKLLKEILERETQAPAQAISVGGGALMREENRLVIAAGGTAVQLSISTESAAERVVAEEEAEGAARKAGSVKRPMLFGSVVSGSADAGAETRTIEVAKRRLDELASEREPFYREAKTRVWTDFASADSVAAAVAENVNAAVTTTAIIPDANSTVVVAAGALSSLGARLKEVFPKAEAVAVLVDENVQAAWREQITEALAVSGKRILELPVPSGEKSKTLSYVEQFAEELVRFGMTRDDVLTGIGGGVVGDVSGMLAAVYMRGIEHVQVPTTVVAQVDSAMGGKNGVNLRGGKNLIGTFHPPRIVLSDPELLQSLPEREYLSGMGEVVKYGAVFSVEFFEWLENEAAAILKRDTTALSRIVEQSALFKTGVVARDLHDRLGLRALLNFGHTVGHALEKLSGYGELLHGEAISIGMIEAMKLGLMLGITPKGDMARVASLLQKLGLPTKIPEAVGGVGEENRDRWLGALRADKKRSGGKLSFILLERIGLARVVPVEVETVLKSISSVGEGITGAGGA